MSSLSKNPRITYAVIKLQDLYEEMQDAPKLDYAHIVAHKDQVLKRYQPVFNPQHIPQLTKAEFNSFLDYKNNHHWTDLHRVRKFMTEDMDLLRNALLILLDENRPINERLNEIRPQRSWATDSMVSHLGMPVLTAILLVAHPALYGVWNNTSDEGMRILRLWKEEWNNEPAGDVYQEMNEIYLELCRQVKIDLWTLDALWWVLRKQ